MSISAWATFASLDVSAHEEWIRILTENPDNVSLRQTWNQIMDLYSITNLDKFSGLIVSDDFVSKLNAKLTAVYDVYKEKLNLSIEDLIEEVKGIFGGMLEQSNAGMVVAREINSHLDMPAHETSRSLDNLHGIDPQLIHF